MIWWDLQLILELALSVFLGMLGYDGFKAAVKRWRAKP
jgi:hypothetical protein